MPVSVFQTVQSFVQFLLNWYLGGGKLVDQNTANIRAEICAGCFNNKPHGEIQRGCSSCGRMGGLVLNSIRTKIIGEQKTNSDGNLLACDLCGCDLKIKVWIPNSVLLSAEDANAYPTFCWKKKILQGTEV